MTTSTKNDKEVLTVEEMTALIEEMYRRGLLPRSTKEDNTKPNLEPKNNSKNTPGVYKASSKFLLF